MKRFLILIGMFLLSTACVYANAPCAGYNNAIHDRGYQQSAFGRTNFHYYHPQTTLGSFNNDGSFTSFPRNTFIQNYGSNYNVYYSNGNPLGLYRQKSNGYYVVYNNMGTRIGTYRTLEKARLRMQQYYQW